MAEQTAEQKAPAAKAEAEKKWKATGTYRSPGSGDIAVAAVRNGVLKHENGSTVKDENGKETPVYDLAREGASEPFCTGCPARPAKEVGYYTPDA